MSRYEMTSVWSQKQTLLYNGLTLLWVFLSISILHLEEDYVELDEIVEDLNELDEKTDDEQKPKKPETGN